MSVSSFSQAIKIFFSYATFSSKDKHLFDRLMQQLSVLRRERFIDEWYDSDIVAGGDIPQAIEAYLRTANIIVILISAEFLHSERCYGLEMQRALELSATGAAHLIPVILSSSDWKSLPLARYSPLPADGTPVSRKRNIDAALFEVARGIRKVAEELASRVKRIHTHADVSQFPLHHYPYRQNVFFTDRETILDTLSAFFTSAQTHQTRILALNGLGWYRKNADCAGISLSLCPPVSNDTLAQCIFSREV